MIPSNRKAWIIVAIFFPVFLAYGCLYRQAFSLPYLDDYHAILDFAIRYQQAPTWTAKVLEIIGHQHNEYKLIFEHLVVASELQLTGHLNFGFLIGLGNFFLIPIAYLLWRIHVSEEGPSNGRLVRFIPISFLFFSLTYWETLDWAMAGLTNIPVIFFVLLSLKLMLSEDQVPVGRGRLLSSCAAAFGAFTSASGFLLAPLGLLILLRRRAYAASLLWCVTYLIPLLAYLYRYVPLQRAHVPYSAKMVFFFLFCGAAIPGVSNSVRALFGIVVMVVFAISVRCQFQRTHPTSFYFTLWILLCGGLVAWIRGPIAPRYTVYSILLFIFVYKVILVYIPWRVPRVGANHMFVICLAFSIAVCIIADINAYQRLGEVKRMVLSGMDSYVTRPEANSPLEDPAIRQLVPGEAEYERTELGRAIQRRVIPRPIMQNLH